DFAEMLDSQERMLRRLGRPAIPRDEMIPAYTLHLERVHHWLARQPHMANLRVRYKSLVERTEVEVARANEFLGGRLNVAEAVRVVDPSLYRNRAAEKVVSGESFLSPPNELTTQAGRSTGEETGLGRAALGSYCSGTACRY